MLSLAVIRPPPFPEKKVFPDVLNAFVQIAANPFSNIDINDNNFKLLVRFVIIVYDSGSNLDDINMCRLGMFPRRQDLDSCPTYQSCAVSTHEEISVAGR